MPFVISITTERPDGELMELTSGVRDLEALGDLYQRYMDLAYGLCLKYLEDPEAGQGRRDGYL